MKDKKKTTRKFSIAMLAMACVMAVALGGIVGVLAASMQSLDSSFDVEYSVGNNIASQVSAKYQIADDEEVGMGSVTISAVDAGGTQYANLEAKNQIALTGKKQYVVFTYTFQNIGSADFMVAVSDNCLQKNVKIEYSATNLEVLSGETKTITVAVSIINANHSAYYQSNHYQGVSWSLSSL